MPASVAAEDGTTYTEHYACDPLENEATLALCLTCHEAQGVEDVDAMVAFTQGKMAELSERQVALHEDVNELYGLLVEATAAGDVDADVLEAARDAYTRGLFYYQYQTQLTSGKADTGAVAAHNIPGTLEVIEKAEGIVQPAIESLR